MNVKLTMKNIITILGIDIYKINEGSLYDYLATLIFYLYQRIEEDRIINL